MSFLFGFIGYLLYFLYDLNQIFKFSNLVKYGFSLGSICLFLGTISACGNRIVNYVAFGFVIIALALEIYILFFALNFEDTYVKEEFHVCDKGLYALCRHPGFYSFALLYLALYFSYQDVTLIYLGLMYNVLNLLYILFQDIFVFPKLFKDYDEYKKTTPCLLFNKQSIKRCIRDFRGQR